MSGRIEKDQMVEKKIISLVKDKPKIIREYSNSFGDKTALTKMSYILDAIHFVDFLGQEYGINADDINSIKNLNYMHITSYMNYIKTHTTDGRETVKEAGTCAADFYAVKHFCKFLFLCKYINENPCENVEVPKDKKQHEVVSLTPDEINIFKNNIKNGVGSHRAKARQSLWKTRDYCIVTLDIVTGLRVSALANIDISDINFEQKTLKTIEKGNVERTIYLSDKIIDIIQEWMRDREKILNGVRCDALFISAKKHRIGVTTIRDLIDKYTYNIPKHITPHKLRSTAATNLYDSTGDIYLVADVLGHKNIQNTRRYAQVSATKRINAANQLSELI